MIGWKSSTLRAATLWLILFFPSHSQAAEEQPAAGTQQNAARVLAGWSGLNLFWATAEIARGTDKPHYHRMNGWWNTVNLALSGAMAFGEPSPPQTLAKILAFNTGLDFAYMSTGLYLKARADGTSDTQEANKLRQYGNSLILQGGFLLIFDAVFWWAVERDAPLKAVLIDQRPALAFTVER